MHQSKYENKCTNQTTGIPILLLWLDSNHTVTVYQSFRLIIVVVITLLGHFDLLIKNINVPISVYNVYKYPIEKGNTFLQYKYLQKVDWFTKAESDWKI